MDLFYHEILAITFHVVFLHTVSATLPQVMAITSTPYGAGTSGASFACLLGQQATTSTVNIMRYVRQSNKARYTYDLPEDSTLDTTMPNVRLINLPETSEAQGMYTCQVSNNGENFDATVPLLHFERNFQAENGEFTVTVNIDERKLLEFENIYNYLPQDINVESLSNFEVVEDRGTNYYLPNIEETDSDVYACLVIRLRETVKYGMIRLIVRACPSERWNAPLCEGICDLCYNGGVCSDLTGECVCPPGFAGKNCLESCGEDTFGWDCQFGCGIGQVLAQCSGSQLCMQDPYGCSCASGYGGLMCDEACDAGTFGAGCKQTCQCNSGSCDRFTGRCIGTPAGCENGWTGSSCQVPEVCPTGYYGAQCTETCHCENNEECDKTTGFCSTTVGKCAPGYMSSTGVNQDNCQRYVGCHSECTMTCHCEGGADDCIKDDPDPTRNGMCLSGNCAQEWYGINCQAGIWSVSTTRANPGQIFQATCSVIDPDNADLGSSAVLKTNSLNNPTSTIPATQPSVTSLELYGVSYNFVELEYSVSVANSEEALYCVAVVEGNMASTLIPVNLYELPVLGEPPISLDMGESWVYIEWKAWGTSVSDTGEGPIVEYRIYYKQQNKGWTLFGSEAFDSNMNRHMHNITELSQGTAYKISVAVVRQGVNGEGLRMSVLSITTLGDPPPTTMPPPPDSTTVLKGSQAPSTQGSNIAILIILPILGILLFIAFVVLAFFFWKRRKSSRSMSADLPM